jgi:hypothetical protein
MHEDARKLPWLYCLDHILNKMSTRISLLRDKSRDKTGVVPECAAKLEERWIDCAGHSIV